MSETTQQSTEGVSLAETGMRPATPINEEPPEITLDEAASRIDTILKRQSQETQHALHEFKGDRFQSTGENREGEAEETAETDRQTRPLSAEEYEAVRVKVKAGDEEHELSLKQLSDVYEKAHSLHSEARDFSERRKVVEQALFSAVQQLQTAAPYLEWQLMGDFPELQTPADLQRLAFQNPQRFLQFQERQAQLQQVKAEVEGIRAYEFDRNLMIEAGRLAELLPEFADPEKGDRARQAVHQYANSLGISDDRLREASAIEVTVLHKAMKYDELQGNMKSARKKTKRPAKVMRPGTDRPSDSRASYRKAMARLKKTGRVEDAAKVIEHML
ncbi:MAG: hypothetical protein EP347_05045 [Alphaproteobacteria bacterium]|nr:MAG: hypothetical protein EP347_05045 [Alphaproteobacteria bacterium]